MSLSAWTYLAVGITLALLGLKSWASRSRAGKGFYVADMGVSPLANGMALAGDRIGAASFISLAGLISVTGYSGSAYVMGWIGGYFLLGLVLAPYLRRFLTFSIMEFVGKRYRSDLGILVALICLTVVLVTYLAAQMRGIGIVLGRFLEVDASIGVVAGMGIVFIYAILGRARGTALGQSAQFCAIAAAYLIPAVLISICLTGQPVPQLGYGGSIIAGPEAGKRLLDVLDRMNQELGFSEYTAAFGSGQKGLLDMIFVTLALMLGTAGLPHILSRSYNVPTAREARFGIAYALFFVAFLYTTAPAVAAFGRYNVMTGLGNTAYEQVPSWFKSWERTGLLAWVDKDGDGKIHYSAGPPFEGPPKFTGTMGDFGQRLVENKLTDSRNELYIDHDILVLANPEIAGLPDWVLALVIAGGLIASLCVSTGLLLIVASSVSYDFYSRVINKRATEKQRAFASQIAAATAIVLAGYLGVHPPAKVAEVAAYAFGLAAASFFPVLILGIFWSRSTSQGAIAGMIAGTAFTAFYIVQVVVYRSNPWFFGISPEGIGAVGMMLNFVVAYVVSRITPAPPPEIRELVETIRYPREVLRP